MELFVEKNITKVKITDKKNLGETAARGLRFSRYFSQENIHPFDQIKWTKRKSVITNTDGSIVSGMDSVEVPEDWSQLATDIAVSKFFRKAGK